MCGISGYFFPHGGHTQEKLSMVLSVMAQTLNHRGPDADGIWHEDKGRVGFAHNRLSIIDTTSCGAQPMTSQNGRYTLCYNGEIYNYQALITKYNLHLKGHSDTEALLELITTIGLENTLKEIHGMFAFAIYDHQERTLDLVRDHVGIKPLYLAEIHGGILFASELKALLKSGMLPPKINPEAAAHYFKYGYVPDPYAIIENVSKLSPGTHIRFRSDGTQTTRRWYTYQYNQPPVQPLSETLAEVIAQHMISDVPLGTFLSGGIDSSLVTALAQAQSSQNIKTFSIGFEDSRYNEAPFAKAIAAHLGTDHYEDILSPARAHAQIERLPEIYDEPFADSSAIPTLLVSAFARKHVTVCLSGDGGDEGFAGYVRYTALRTLNTKLLHWPLALRKTLAGILKTLPIHTLDMLSALIPHTKRPIHTGQKLHKLAGILAQQDALNAYDMLVTLFDTAPLTQNLNLLRTPSALSQDLTFNDTALITSLQLADIHTYLPGDILTKVDRASMHHALEARVPLLDQRILAHGLSASPQELITENKGKQPLRALLKHHVPEHLFDRPKQGFGIPLGAWLRGDGSSTDQQLRAQAEDIFSDRTLLDHGLNPALISPLWRAHLNRNSDNSHALWAVIMFVEWSRKWNATF